MKEIEIQVFDNGKQFPLKVQAYVYGFFAIHRSYLNQEWFTLSHIPSGMGLCQSKLKKDLKACLERLTTGMQPEGLGERVITPFVKEYLLRVLKDYRLL